MPISRWNKILDIYVMIMADVMALCVGQAEM
jgi:hypothetical protein